MSVTPEMARAELARRKSLDSNESIISPEMARAELMRRKDMQSPKQTTPQQVATQQPEEEGTLSRAGRSLARIPKNLGAGTLDLVDFLATPAREAVNLGSKGLAAIGIGSGRQASPIADQFTKGVDTLTGGYTAPKNNAEITSDAIQRGIGGMPAGGALANLAKGAKYAPQIVKSVGDFLKGSNALTASNVGGTAAISGTIQHSLNQKPEDVVGALSTGAAAGIGTSALPSIAGLLTKKGRGSLSGKFAQKAGEKLNINPEAIESFNNSGITPTLADVSNSSRLKMVSSKLEKLPFVGGRLQEVRELQKKELMEGLRQGEEGISKAEASSLVKKGAKQYQNEKGTQFGKMFDKVEQDIESMPNSHIGMKNVDDYFGTIFKKIKTASQSKKFEKSPLGQMYKDLYETAEENGGKVPYHHMKDVLDEINNKITTHGLIGKVDQGKLKQFGAHIAKDIESGLEPQFKELGGDSYKNWKASKNLYSEYAQHDIPKLNELYKKDKKGATEAFVDLITNQKKGAEKAKIVLDGLDHKDQLDLTDAIHKQLGKTTDGSFSPLKWVRGYKDLDPEAQKILLSPLNKKTQEKFNAIADTIDHMKSTLNEANTSKTAYFTALDKVASWTGLATVGLVSGNPIPAAKLAGMLVLGKVASEKFFTNPKFINWMDKGMKAKNLNQFQKILNHPPKVGALSKTLYREIQTFQHDLNVAKKDQEKKKRKDK